MMERPTHAMPLLSPYSIQAALAMTYAYAAGDTRAERAKVLHPFVTRLSPFLVVGGPPPQGYEL